MGVFVASRGSGKLRGETSGEFRHVPALVLVAEWVGEDHGTSARYRSKRFLVQGRSKYYGYDTWSIKAISEKWV